MNNYTVYKFWAPWCVPCQGLNKVLSKDKYLINGEAVILRSLNVDEEAGASMSADLGIRGVPTLVLFKDGAELARRSGGMTLVEFEAWVAENL